MESLDEEILQEAEQYFKSQLEEGIFWIFLKYLDRKM